MHHPSPDEAKRLAASGNRHRIPVENGLPAGIRTPIESLTAAARASRPAFGPQLHPPSILAREGAAMARAFPALSTRPGSSDAKGSTA